MLITADRIIHEGYAYRDVGIDVNEHGRIRAVAPLKELGKPDRTFTGKALMAGTVNAHSHAFQRLLRGRSQLAGPAGDNFWSWREIMYWVAQTLEPHELYVVARQSFIEMLLAGVTTVGEFHYLHHRPDGQRYDNLHAMADALVYAAREVGIRLSVIHTVYLRGDFDAAPSPQQARFCARSLDDACDQFDGLVERLISYNDPRLSWAIAAHSLRAVPIEAVVGIKVRLGHMPFHIHVSEQEREVARCLEKHQMGPVELLARSELCDACTTLVHATHLRPGEADAIAEQGALVCFCPTTEADLGDGIGPAGELFRRGVSLCLGTDGQVQPSILAEARRLEMHERLRSQQRNILARGEGDAPAKHLLAAASLHGATSLGVDTGLLHPGRWADMITLDLQDPTLAGADDHFLASHIVFSADSRAVRDVCVGGKWVVEDGHHRLAGDSAVAYNKVVSRLFRQSPPGSGASVLT